MDATENVGQEFTMEFSCLLLISIVFMGIILLWLIKDENVKEQETQQLMNQI
jgi:preprotein translocase subunit YajC